MTTEPWPETGRRIPHYEIRARRFVDVSRIDTSCSVYGADWSTPIEPLAEAHGAPRLASITPEHVIASTWG